MCLLAADVPVIDLWKARGKGNGTKTGAVSYWSPAIITTKDNVTLVFAQADRATHSHDPSVVMRRSVDFTATVMMGWDGMGMG